MLNDAALVVGANAIVAAIRYMQMHSDAPGTTGLNAVGTRVAVNGTVDADGDITWSNVAFTGLPANQAVSHVGYWSAVTAGTFYGSAALGAGSDLAANAAGEFTVTSVVETSTAS